MEKGMCGKERRWGATIILIHKQEGCLGMTGAACGHGEGVLLFGGRHGPPLPQTERSGEDGERERVDGEGGESVEPEDDRGRLYGGTGGKSLSCDAFSRALIFRTSTWTFPTFLDVPGRAGRPASLCRRPPTHPHQPLSGPGWPWADADADAWPTRHWVVSSLARRAR